jgi:cysteine desulfurase
MCSIVYCDYNASAPLRPEARAAMLQWWEGPGGNPASPHEAGRRAARAVSDARAEVAGLVDATPGEVVFTSGATESNNLALSAAVSARPGAALITSRAEHPSVLRVVEALATRGQRTHLVPVNPDGVLDYGELEQLLTDNPGAVLSVMWANNETGALNDLPRVVEVAHRYGALVHSDATQAVGRVPVRASASGVDLLSLSGHKFGGPQGVGALLIARGLGLRPTPVTHGGGQEGGWRSGTSNVAGLVGLGAAAAAARREMADEMPRVAGLRQEFESRVAAALPDVTFLASASPRLPGVSSIWVPGTPADAVLAGMVSVAASDGSACSSGAPTVSHVLTAMGMSADDAECVLRFSFGHATSALDIEVAARELIASVHYVRAVLKGTATVEPGLATHSGSSR